MTEKDVNKLIESLGILVVDENAYTRKITRMMLTSMGAKLIYEAADGVAAIDTIRGANPDIAMIYAAFRDADNTFLWMNRAVDERATALGNVAGDPLLDFISMDSRFPPLIRRIGLDQAPAQPTSSN